MIRLSLRPSGISYDTEARTYTEAEVAEIRATASNKGFQAAVAKHGGQPKVETPTTPNKEFEAMKAKMAEQEQYIASVKEEKAFNGLIDNTKKMYTGANGATGGHAKFVKEYRDDLMGLSGEELANKFNALARKDKFYFAEAPAKPEVITTLDQAKKRANAEEPVRRETMPNSTIFKRKRK